MAGQASGGQQLTPNRNQSAAPAGVGGDTWGAFGGGITPVGNGVTGPTGFDERVVVTAANGQTAENYIVDGNNRALLGEQSIGAFGGTLADDSIASGAGNKG